MLDKRLLELARKHGKLLGYVVTISVCGGLLAVAQANYLARIIDAVFLQQRTLGDVTIWLGIAAAAMLARAVFLWLGELMAQRLAARIKSELRATLTNYLLALGPVGIGGQQTGELLHVVTEGVESLEPYFTRYLPQVAVAGLIPLLLLVIIVPLDLTSALILLVTAPLIPLFMVLIGRLAEQRNQKQWAVLSRLSAHFLDVMQGLPTLKLFGRSVEQAAVISRVSDEFRLATMDVLKIAFLSALALELLATISTALIAVTIGLRLLFFQMEFFQAFFILLLAPEFYLPLRSLGSHFHAGMSGTVAAERIFELYKLPLLRAQNGSGMLLPTGAGIEISFEKVYYAYQNGERPALQDFSVVIAPGEQVAVVGASGAGKSTVAALLLRFMDPLAGVIRINGIPLTQLDRADWLAQVAYVPQAPHLFYRSVADNIRLGRATATLAEVQAAAVAAGAAEFIQNLPQGYDTIIGEGGQALSGGESQRLAIARAFLQKAPVLVLDEATAGLDPATETVVQQSLERLKAGKTVIIMAHRLTTVYKADRIIVIEDGHVGEVGNHTELLQKKGMYHQLVTAYRGAV